MNVNHEELSKLSIADLKAIKDYADATIKDKNFVTSNEEWCKLVSFGCAVEINSRVIEIFPVTEK